LQSIELETVVQNLTQHFV